MNSIQLIGVILLIITAVPANGIVWTYTAVPWRKTKIGRALVTKSVGLALLIDFGIVRNLGPESWQVWLDWTRLVTFPLLTAGLYLQWRAFRDTLALAKAAELEAGRPPPADNRSHLQ